MQFRRHSRSIKWAAIDPGKWAGIEPGRKSGAIDFVAGQLPPLWYISPHRIRWFSRPFMADYVDRTRGATIMCFSATASFSVAATTAVIGLAAVRQVKHPRQLLLAIVPFLFAFQQAVEGVLWLQLSGEGDSGKVAVLSLTFRIFAEVLWPAYTALAVLLIEPDRRRRRILSAIAVIGSILSAYLLVGLLGEPPAVAIRGHSIDYASDVNALSWQMVPYLLCTCAALFLSSHRIIQAFAVIILVGFIVSAYVYFATFISVWCFFTAAASSLVYFYFQRSAMIVPLHHH